MKKVSGYISVRALGTYDFEFYVEDDTTDAEIAELVEKKMMVSSNYTVEEGYRKVITETYEKEDKESW